jgi:cellulose biosynthesis protein BcsQ
VKSLAVYNIKGGVGKTSTAVNLAHLASLRGYRTLIWDLDPQGSTTFYLRVRPKVKGGSSKLLHSDTELFGLIKETDYQGLDLLPADFSYRKLDFYLHQNPRGDRMLPRLLSRLATAYDLLFVDCAPGVTFVIESLFSQVNGLIVPTIPSTLSIQTLQRLSKRLAKKASNDLKVFPFFSMVDRRKVLHRSVSAENNYFGLRFLNTRIPYSSIVEQMGVRRAPLSAFAARSEAAQAFEQLWAEIHGSLDT